MQEVAAPPLHSSPRSSIPTLASRTEIPILTADGEGNGHTDGGGDRREHRWGGEGLGRGGSFTSVDFSVQSNGLREVEEARTAMLAFDWYDNRPQALRCRHSSLTPQTTAEITSCIKLLGLGKGHSDFQGSWSQGRPSLKAAAFAIRNIRQVRMTYLKQVPFTLMGRGGGLGVGGGYVRERGRICSASY